MITDFQTFKAKLIENYPVNTEDWGDILDTLETAFTAANPEIEDLAGTVNLNIGAPIGVAAAAWNSLNRIKSGKIITYEASLTITTDGTGTIVIATLPDAPNTRYPFPIILGSESNPFTSTVGVTIGASSGDVTLYLEDGTPLTDEVITFNMTFIEGTLEE